jgi:hypothetical protein
MRDDANGDELMKTEEEGRARRAEDRWLKLVS